MNMKSRALGWIRGFTLLMPLLFSSQCGQRDVKTENSGAGVTSGNVVSNDQSSGAAGEAGGAAAAETEGSSPSAEDLPQTASNPGIDTGMIVQNTWENGKSDVKSKVAMEVEDTASQNTGATGASNAGSSNEDNKVVPEGLITGTDDGASNNADSNSNISTPTA